MGKHSNIKPPEPEKPAKDNKDEEKAVEVEVRAPIKESLPRPPIDTPFTVLKPTVAPALKDTIDKLKVSGVAAPVAAADSDG